MQATMDISIYPSDTTYKEIIIQFITDIRSKYTFRIETNGMSTQIFGSYEELMMVMQNEVKQFLSAYHSVAVIKLAVGEKTIERLPDKLKI